MSCDYRPSGSRLPADECPAGEEVVSRRVKYKYLSIVEWMIVQNSAHNSRISRSNEAFRGRFGLCLAGLVPDLQHSVDRQL